MTYAYHPQVLDQLARHGLVPLPTTSPERLRDAVRDLYLHEIRALRGRLLDGQVERRHYADEVIELRKRYFLLSVPVERWTIIPAP